MIQLYARLLIIGALATVGFIVSLLVSSMTGFCIPLAGMC